MIWHLSIREHVRKKKKHMYMFEKITALVWQTNSSSMTVLLISNESKEFKIQNSKLKSKIL